MSHFYPGMGVSAWGCSGGSRGSTTPMAQLLFNLIWDLVFNVPWPSLLSPDPCQSGQAQAHTGSCKGFGEGAEHRSGVLLLGMGSNCS